VREARKAWALLRSYLAARWRFRRLRGDALLRYQDESARAVIDYAARHSPFHRARFAGGGDWRTVPTIDKSAMMENFGAFNTRGISLGEAMTAALRAERDRDFAPSIGGVTVGLSSGTSGHRGLFLVDPIEQVTWAGTILARALPDLSRLRLAFFLRSNSNLYQSLGRWIDFRYFDLTTPIETTVALLNAYQPDVIAGPPSLLGRLADSPALRIRPRRLVSVAEVLEPQDEARLRDAFGVPVHQVYQCTEGLLAVSCERGSLHVQEDVVALQFERADPDGEQLTPIITDLRRRTQPVIRYKLNDAVTLAADPCPCGSAFRVIERIEGRCDDACTFLRRDGTLRALFPEALRRIVLQSDPRIDDYQIVQERPGQLRIRLRVRGDFAEVASALRKTMAEALARYDCEMPELQIDEGLAAVPPGEKRRRVRRVGERI
jgi:putative adenylate-forming enzyme